MLLIIESSMQKILDQKLSGSEEDAKAKAIYTWEKNEIAWIFNTTYLDVFKVKFTGEHWLCGNKWGWYKIYQYRYLECSGEHFLNSMGLNDDGISHDEEDKFYSTKEEALNRGYRCIVRIRNEAVKDFEKVMKRLGEYKQKQ